MMDNGLTYRLATREDSRLFFYWANDDAVRTNSFSPREIDWEEHESWFHEKLACGNSYLLVFFRDAGPVGQARLDRLGDNILEIDYSVDKAWRGKKIGREILIALKSIADKFFSSFVLKGTVQVQNTASAKAFEAAGFARKEEVMMKDISCYIYYSY